MKLNLSNLALAALLAVLPVSPASADDMSTASHAVWHRHLESALSGNLDAVMADFADHSVIMTPEGIIEGKVAIRGFFERLLAGMSPEVAETIAVNADLVRGKVVLFNFTVGAAGRTFHDTAVIEHGKIVALTTVDYAGR